MPLILTFMAWGCACLCRGMCNVFHMWLCSMGQVVTRCKAITACATDSVLGFFTLLLGRYWDLLLKASSPLIGAVLGLAAQGIHTLHWGSTGTCCSRRHNLLGQPWFSHTLVLRRSTGSMCAAVSGGSVQLGGQRTHIFLLQSASWPPVSQRCLELLLVPSATLLASTW